jgi:ketosteroid isomerase-like protein
MSRTHQNLLKKAYAAFNARDIDAVLAVMHPNVMWTIQVHEPGQSLVDVHQVVHETLSGIVLWRSRVALQNNSQLQKLYFR